MDATPPDSGAALRVVDLGRMRYAPAYAEQGRRVEEVLASRAAGGALIGTILLVEHEPVITVSNRPSARRNLIATPEVLARHGVEVEATDRGGDITYHGPGQLVVYPILDLNRLNLGLHEYMRLLEEAVVRACGVFGVEATRDATATGVWVRRRGAGASASGAAGDGELAKVCAMGVRVRKWVSMHGLALNVSPEMGHFDLIVPCGLVGRAVTSLAEELGARGPGMEEAKRVVVGMLREEILGAAGRASAARGGTAGA